MDWQGANGVDAEASRPPAPFRTSSKRALSASPTPEEVPIFTSLGDGAKRLRSNSSCPSALSKALAAHQAIFDSHKIPPISWSDLSKRLHRLQADISAHPARLRAWSSAALADLTAARDADVADLARRTRHVDAATRLVGAAQEERRAARGRLREQLGAPWSAEEETFWTTLTALDGAEDAVCDVLLGLALYGFGSAG